MNTSVLVVEDNKLNLELLVTVLSSNGYEVLPAEGALTAVEIAQSRIPELILMDIQMPDIDGYMALEMLREDEKTAKIPVIAVTGNAMSHDIENVKKKGFDNFVTKPFRIAHLLDVVSQTLQSANFGSQRNH